MLSNRNITIISFLLLAGFMQIVWPIPSPVPTNQIFMILGMILVLNQLVVDEFRFNWPCLAFLIAIVISIVINPIPSLFKPWQRFVQFLFLAIAAAPMIVGPDVDRMRRHMNMGILWACGIISVLSFAAYVTGTGAYLRGIVRGYMGITPHPNFLGMYVMVAMVWFSSLFFRSTKLWEHIIWGGCWLVSLLVVLLTASRGSMVCALLGTVVVVYLRYRGQSDKLVTAFFVLVCSFIVALPYLMPYMETMMHKGLSLDSEKADELVEVTRGSIWKLRFAEIHKSPLFGVGAFSCDVDLPFADVFYDKRTGSVEQGSSWLGLLAQIGWIGFTCFLCIIVPIVRKAYKYAFLVNTPYAQLMFALIVAVFFHMIVEGYAITAGAIQCVILWLLLSAADQCDKVADYPVFWEKEDPISPEEYELWKNNHEV